MKTRKTPNVRSTEPWACAGNGGIKPSRGGPTRTPHPSGQGLWTCLREGKGVCSAPPSPTHAVAEAAAPVEKQLRGPPIGRADSLGPQTSARLSGPGTVRGSGKHGRGWTKPPKRSPRLSHQRRGSRRPGTPLATPPGSLPEPPSVRGIVSTHDNLTGTLPSPPRRGPAQGRRPRWPLTLLGPQDAAGPDSGDATPTRSMGRSRRRGESREAAVRGGDLRREERQRGRGDGLLVPELEMTDGGGAGRVRN